MPQILTESEMEYSEEFGVGFPFYLSQAEYEQLPDAGFEDELLDGELIVSPSASISHSLLVDRIREALAP